VIAIVGYGLGNVEAIANIYKRENIPAVIATSASQLREATRLILPGVGSFDWAMQRLNASGMRDELEIQVRQCQKPVLGICVGFQMMARRSDEGRDAGLGWIGAEVRRFATPAGGPPVRLPHMGWNDAVALRPSHLFEALDVPMRFYFLHSYYFVPDRAEDVLTQTEFCGHFCSSAGCGNVFGVQFHPEKSHQWGVRLLRNFALS
jgi:glutamine amidotransferase